MVCCSSVEPRAARIAVALLLVGIYSTLAVARRISNALRDANLLRVSVAVAFAVSLIVLVVFVVRSPALRRPRVVLSLLGLAGGYALVVWPMDSPEEKLHFLEYGVVAVLAFFAGPVKWVGFSRFAFAALFTGAAGWLDEGIQALLPSRYYDLRDVGFNALAGVMALASLALFRRSTRAHA
jgi:hypothetical protein